MVITRSLSEYPEENRVPERHLTRRELRQMEDEFVKVRFQTAKLVVMGALLAALVGCGQKEAPKAEGEKAPAEAPKAEEGKAEEAAAPKKTGMEGLASVPYIGPDDPKVVIIESSDFQ